ncbi:V-type proton ATPase subunit e-like [Arctopsyche grandis]|uniref:V-type proton ATPase subunit e-like n=1 Tax=Arctopsyche grandis TaxID=121162 RepID=UPI00406D7887
MNSDTSATLSQRHCRDYKQGLRSNCILIQLYRGFGRIVSSFEKAILNIMVFEVSSFATVTVIWAVVGIVIPIILFASKNPSRPIVQSSMLLTGVSCWLFWLCCYMTQMNPLFGPKMGNHTVLMIAKNWGNLYTE